MDWKDILYIIGAIAGILGLVFAFFINKRSIFLKRAFAEFKKDFQFEYLYQDCLITFSSCRKSLKEDNIPVENLRSELLEKLTTLKGFNGKFIEEMGKLIDEIIGNLDCGKFDKIHTMLDKIIGLMKNPNSIKGR